MRKVSKDCVKSDMVNLEYPFLKPFLGVYQTLASIRAILKAC